MVAMRTVYGYRNSSACPSPSRVDDHTINSAATGGCEDELYFSTTGSSLVQEADERVGRSQQDKAAIRRAPTRQSGDALQP